MVYLWPFIKKYVRLIILYVTFSCFIHRSECLIRHIAKINTMKISMLTGMVLLLLCAFGVSAQTLSPDLISSSGGHDTYGGGSLSWSLAEGITETVQNQNVIMNQGFQQSWIAPFVVSQIINIPNGWSMFSTYIDPNVDSIPVVLSSIVNDVVIVKNGLGLIY